MPTLRALCLTLLLPLATLVLLPTSPANADRAEASLNPVAAASVSAGYNHSCVVTEQRTVRCWGDGTYGRLGYGNTDRIGDGSTVGAEDAAAAGDVPLGGLAVAVEAGQEHTCALLTTGAVRCWGRNNYGQLGYGNTTDIGDDETPASAGDVPLGGPAKAISVGTTSTCALRTSGEVYCWGQGAFGKLGYGDGSSVGDDETPAEQGPVALGSAAAEVSVGGSHTCVLMPGGTVRCWGQGLHGALGYGNDDGVTSAAAAGDVPVGGSVVSLSTGGMHTCAVLTTGGVRCWGNGDDGRLGYGDTDAIGNGTVIGKETPAAAGNVPLGGLARAVSAGSGHTCAILTTAAVRCWGYGLYGRPGYAHTNNVGDGTTPGYETPAAAGDVAVGGNALALNANNHTCAVLSDATLRCWGHGNAGKLGYGVPVVGIGDNETPASAGAVPVGAPVRIDAVAPAAKAKTKLTVKGLPKRDKSAPFRFKLKGKLKGSFAHNATNCKGKVKLKLKRGNKLVAFVKAPLTKKCTFKKNVKVKPGKLGPSSGKVKIKVQASFGGNNALLGSKGRTKVYAR
ncbi:RCC1 domain-containing protein [Nocardioides sp.]|uniref:RCC1 domain-containing protein n=1 Tax=Nocardioides sp. TaxID=35761 RepID=UPI003569387E